MKLLEMRNEQGDIDYMNSLEEEWIEQVSSLEKAKDYMSSLEDV